MNEKIIAGVLNQLSKEFKNSSELSLMTLKAVEQKLNSLKAVTIKGDDGYTPIKDKDYYDGYTPIKGKDYRDGKDAPPIDYEKIIKKATPKKYQDYLTKEDLKAIAKLVKVPKPKDGVDGVSPNVDEIIKIIITKISGDMTGKKIVEAINDITEADDKWKIDAKHIKGLRQTVQNFYGSGTGGTSSTPSATDFLALTDTPDSYSGQSAKGVRVNAGETALEFYTVVDTDEKVKLSAVDPTADYLNNKLSGASGITYLNGVVSMTSNNISQFTNDSGYVSSSNLSGLLKFTYFV